MLSDVCLSHIYRA